MDKSIETIWTNGFANEKKLSAPKIDRHYHKKSKLVIEKIKRTMDIDNKSLMPMALIIVVSSWYYDRIYLGIFLAISIISLFIFNTKNYKIINNIEFKDSTLKYLKEYQKMTFNLRNMYTNLLRYIFPLVVNVSYWLFFRGFDEFNQTVSKLGILKIVLLTSISLGLSSLIFVFAYKLSNKILYGRQLKKIDRMIEELSNQEN